ncbi:MAG: EAL domain-containing protein [Rhodocyclales bacterium]|nr:EAL domain-containing protein [Rhodocyclales bacterium]
MTNRRLKVFLYALCSRLRCCIVPFLMLPALFVPLYPVWAQQLPEALRQHSLPALLVAPDGGRIVDANEAAIAFYGYPPERLRGGMTIVEINQLTADEVQREMDEARRQRRNFFVFPHRLASGEIVATEVYSSPVRIDGRTYLLSLVLPETRATLLQTELQRYQNRLEELVAVRTEALQRTEAARRELLGWAVIGLGLLLALLAAAYLRLRRAQHQTRHLAEELELTLEGAGLGRILWDVERRVATFCPRIQRILGLPGERPIDVPLEQWVAMIHPEERERVHQVVVEHLNHTRPNVDLRYRIRHADGSWRWLETWARAVDREGGRVRRIAGLARDVTAAVQLEESQRIAASVFHALAEGVVVTDTDLVILEVNDALLRMTGFSREEVIGARIAPWRSHRHDRSFYEAMWETLRARGSWHGEVWNQTKAGQPLPTLLTISVVYDEQRRPTRYVAAMQDITTLKAQQQMLERLAYHDELTGLPNRVLLNDRLAQALAAARRHGTAVAIAYLDLDGFKPINDRCGHEAGDDVLRLTARRLQGTLRETDTLARIGGDEFVAVITDLASPEDWQAIVERMLSVTRTPIKYGDELLQLTTSIGVTVYPEDDADPEVLLRHADLALYQAKQAGKNRYCRFDARLDREQQARRSLSQAVIEGIEREELRLYLQPRVELASGRIEGAEALVRWRHPTRGLLAPGAFIPAIENDEAIVRLGNWVFERALAQLTDWTRQGRDWLVSVNVAPRQLLDPTFPRQLEERLKRYPDAPPQRLELEIVESSALDAGIGLEQLMMQCRTLGVRMSIDDFGSGYSSLAYLKRVPAHAIKIDQAFVIHLLDETDDYRIVEAVLELARTFDLHCVAEGVETVEHGEYLLRLGADVAQGYGIAHPMPQADFTNWALRWQQPPQWGRWRDTLANPLCRQMARFELTHRHWFARLEYHLRDPAATPPPELDPHRCDFGRWLDKEGREFLARRPGFAEIERTHEAMHHAARHLLAANEAGAPPNPALHQEVLSRHRALVGQLQALALAIALGG